MIIFTVLVFIQSAHAAYADDFTSTINNIERDRILTKAKELQSIPARTVTADIAARSKGGRHDFFSEGDYWWPDPENPKARYIRRDGETNPDNFIEHRLSLMRFSDFVGTFTSAYLLTNDKAYADRAIVHLKAWFVDEETRMNPSLHYGAPMPHVTESPPALPAAAPITVMPPTAIAVSRPLPEPLP